MHNYLYTFYNAFVCYMHVLECSVYVLLQSNSFRIAQQHVEV